MSLKDVDDVQCKALTPNKCVDHSMIVLSRYFSNVAMNFFFLSSVLPDRIQFIRPTRCIGEEGQQAAETTSERGREQENLKG